MSDQLLDCVDVVARFSRCVAKLYRKLWLVTRLLSPAQRTACVMAWLTEPSWAWCRRLVPIRGSTAKTADGKTHLPAPLTRTRSGISVLILRATTTSFNHG